MSVLNAEGQKQLLENIRLLYHSEPGANEVLQHTVVMPVQEAFVNLKNNGLDQIRTPEQLSETLSEMGITNSLRVSIIDTPLSQSDGKWANYFNAGSTIFDKKSGPFLVAAKKDFLAVAERLELPIINLSRIEEGYPSEMRFSHNTLECDNDRSARVTKRRQIGFSLN